MNHSTTSFLNMKKKNINTMNLVHSIQIPLEFIIHKNLNIAEFGTGDGSHTKFIYEYIKKNNIKLYTFDWFKGLPEDSAHGKKGKYACDIPELVLNKDEIILYEGLFKDTLPDFIEEHNEPLGCIIIDCDLYESTKTVLESIDKLIIPGTIIYFDEYYGHLEHEHKAFIEYVKKFNREFEYLIRGDSIQMIVKVTR